MYRVGQRSVGRLAWLVKRLGVVVCGCLLLRAAAGLVEGDIVLPERLGTAVLALELPGGGEAVLPEAGDPAQEAQPPEEDTGDASPAPDGEEGLSPIVPGGTQIPGEPQGGGASDGDAAPLQEGDDSEDADPPVSPEPEAAERDAIGTTITGKGGGYTAAGDGIYIKNKTTYDIDVESYLQRPLDFSVEAGDAVLIIHTHSSEAYNPTPEDAYVASDPSRTEDPAHNVIRVGDELEQVLTQRGIKVYHNRGLYDYPSYTGSYDRALAAIKEELAAHPEIKAVIDLHRDALEGDGVLYKTVADVGPEPSAQVMILCGTNFSGLKHPDWQENMGFAVKLQAAMVEKYPTLARPMKVSEYRYNQHATPGSLILEVGTNGNTLREALTAVRYFGECMADVLTHQS